MERPPLAMVPAPSLPAAAPRRRTGVVAGQPYTINSEPWQPVGEPGLDLGSQVIQEAGPLGGMGRRGGQGKEDGEAQRADCRTVGQTC